MFAAHKAAVVTAIWRRRLFSRLAKLCDVALHGQTAPPAIGSARERVLRAAVDAIRHQRFALLRGDHDAVSFTTRRENA
jgi:hypothetical protein